MKTGSDLTELQAFRNLTAHKQLCLLGWRKDVDGYVTNEVQSSGSPWVAQREGGFTGILSQFKVQGWAGQCDYGIA